MTTLDESAGHPNDGSAGSGRAHEPQFVSDLIEYIETEVAVEDGDIEPETDLVITGLVDSLGVVLVVGWLETTLGIEIDPGDVVLENFRTVGDMVRFVRAG